MTRPCGCGGTLIDTCNCVIQAGPNTTVSGTGVPENPYIVTAGTTQFTVTDSPTLDLTLTGDGAGTPYDLSGAVRLDGQAGNLLTSTPSGLLVPCTAVQDCVGEAFGPGLLWDPLNRVFSAAVSAEPGNDLLIADDGGLYVSADGTVQPAQPRARLGRGAAQQIQQDVSTIVTFDVIHSNVGGVVSGSRLVAPVAGGYNVGTTIQWQNNPPNNGLRGTFLRLNGTTLIAGEQFDASTSNSTVQNVSTSIDLAAGDYVEVLVQQSDSTQAALAVLSLANFSPTFWMYLTTEGV